MANAPNQEVQQGIDECRAILNNPQSNGFEKLAAGRRLRSLMPIAMEQCRQGINLGACFTVAVKEMGLSPEQLLPTASQTKGEK